MGKKVNIAIQLLPKAEGNVYDIIDRAIEVIAASGVKYKVCPFETVMEGDYYELMQIVDRVQQVAYEYGAEETIVNLKIQRNATHDVFIDDKTGKYDVAE